MCLSLGATSHVSAKEDEKQRIEVKLDGRSSRAPVTKAAVKYLLGNRRQSIKISTQLDLPQSQGLGMSAAGALSASLALSDILGENRQRAFEAAHVAEIRCGSGLGDVSALYRGGITVRRKPGLPPRGEVLRIGGTPEVVLAVIGRRILTKSVLSDPAKRAAINRAGARRVDAIVSDRSLGRLMELSASFALESGLASHRVREAMNASSKLGSSSMAMLGNSVFAIGDSRGLARILDDFGQTFACLVDSRGPRLT